MGRAKVTNKNTIRSVSIQAYQDKFIEEHPKFDFSKFVQIHLDDYMELALEVDNIKEELNNDKTKIRRN